MDEPRKGRQTPTQSIVLPYTKTYGNEAVDIYNTTGRTAQEWQELLCYDIWLSMMMDCGCIQRLDTLYHVEMERMKLW